jgi:hypothetical protein
MVWRGRCRVGGAARLLKSDPVWIKWDETLDIFSNTCFSLSFHVRRPENKKNEDLCGGVVFINEI